MSLSLIRSNRNRDNLPSLWDNFGWDEDFFKSFWNGKKMPAVNISETDDTFLIEVAAPGMQKKDFKVEVEDGLLTISSENEEEKTEEKKNYRRQEYSFESFERCFRLPDYVDTSDVKAQYNGGVLEIGLKKTEVTSANRVEIEVS